MSAHTKTHHTNREWREIFSLQLQKKSEQGLYLKGLRLREGYTQQTLGNLIGVNANNICAMENGKRPIGKEMARRLGVVFKVSYQRFL